MRDSQKIQSASIPVYISTVVSAACDSRLRLRTRKRFSGDGPATIGAHWTDAVAGRASVLYRTENLCAEERYRGRCERRLPSPQLDHTASADKIIRWVRSRGNFQRLPDRKPSGRLRPAVVYSAVFAVRRELIGSSRNSHRSPAAVA